MYQPFPVTIEHPDDLLEFLQTPEVRRELQKARSWIGLHTRRRAMISAFCPRCRRDIRPASSYPAHFAACDGSAPPVPDIIGISGPMHAGKTSVAKFLQEKHGGVIIETGDLVIQAYLDYHRKYDMELPLPPGDYYARTPDARAHLVQFGMASRNENPAWLINQIDDAVGQVGSVRPIIIPGIRFLNEAQAILRSRIGYPNPSKTREILYVEGPVPPGSDPHTESEARYRTIRDRYASHVITNRGTLEDLRATVGGLYQ